MPGSPRRKAPGNLQATLEEEIDAVDSLLKKTNAGNNDVVSSYATSKTDEMATPPEDKMTNDDSTLHLDLRPSLRGTFPLLTSFQLHGMYTGMTRSACGTEVLGLIWPVDLDPVY
ncbi:hypothetical protein NDU88_004901 [Pleurodeles waltl]|uniref:Uncharacterized protein n=1 Tax=Pleurodeles waltl TaxID=8319 RepID=A0AAV7RIN3_PLEWA|nr:hypothetical protein NDU88_004901 [Pleurodeles waltl]